MKKYEITEEQILDLAIGKAKSKLKIMFPEAFEENLQENTWYWGSDKFREENVGLFLYRNDGDIYGFNRLVEWSNNLIITDKNAVIKATDKEVEKALAKECIKRFGKNWKNAKIKKCMYGGVPNRGDFGIEISVTSNRIWNKNGCIFNNGKWAEPLKTIELTMKEIADKFGIKLEELKIINNN